MYEVIELYLKRLFIFDNILCRWINFVDID